LSPVPPETYDVDFVINDDQDNPVENATITFQGTTNPQGNYSFSEIEYGTWNYTVSADGFTDQSGSVLIDQDTEVNVNLVPVEPENYTVTFNVKDDSGNDIPDASINFNGISNPAGDYVFPEIEQGTYSYNIIADGFYTINDEITIDQDAQIMINMTPIPDETFTVVFEISDQQGQAVNNAFITLDDIINPQGIYTFQGLEAGNYDYTVKAEGFHDKNATVNFDQDTIISLSLTPLPPDTYNVNFVVNDPEGQPINNAVITFDGDTNPQGDYSFSEIEQGNYNYSVVAEGYKPYNNSTVVEANTNLQVTLQVQDQESDGFTTFFTILDEQDNNQIEDAVVTFNGQTNPAGDYRFENVPEGVNYFSIHADGYESVEDQLIVIVMDNMNILNRMVPLPPENIVVDARANPEGFAFVSGAGDYPVNDTVSLSTTPISQNYRFIGWMEDGEMVSTEEAYIFLADDHRTIIANYEYIPEEYAIETSLSIENSGIIDGAGQYEKNETVVLEMHLHADFIFKGWMNQAGQIVSRQNPYVFDAVRDLKLTGITEEIIDEDEKTVKAFPNPSTGNITLTNPFDENATLHILNSDGVVIQTRPVNSNNNRIDLRELPPGIYFLKIYFENEVATEKIILR
ncbi:MAG: carboxypeptidase regulatory-like domain-containing protein, partial [Bacteroidota bacterium]